MILTFLFEMMWGRACGRFQREQMAPVEKERVPCSFPVEL